MKEHNRKALTALVRQLESSRGAGAALAEAARWSLLEELDRLLGDGIDPNIALGDGVTPLMYAGSKESAQRLLKAGADPNARDDAGRTPLIWFFLGMHRRREAISRVKLLLSHGADPRVADNSGRVAIDHAAPKYDSDVIDLLR